MRGNYAIPFWDRVEVQPDGCWYWTGALSNGYGVYRDPVIGKLVKAHRFAYVNQVGPIPDGLQLDHTCHTDDPTCRGGECVHRRCINPAHLEPVTNLINGRRGRAGQVNRERLLARTHCKRNHPFDAQVTRSDGRVERVCTICRKDWGK